MKLIGISNSVRCFAFVVSKRMKLLAGFIVFWDFFFAECFCGWEDFGKFVTQGEVRRLGGSWLCWIGYCRFRSTSLTRNFSQSKLSMAFLPSSFTFWLLDNLQISIWRSLPKEVFSSSSNTTFYTSPELTPTRPFTLVLLNSCTITKRNPTNSAMHKSGWLCF
jgi:hypothetical protein